ncbi:MAG: histidinol-phosphatase, partial [Clostridia bacterium]|nr:histidinol-phosphatase [Clostridia bacterium]
MILGDFHVHSNYSDGKNSLEEMVQAAIAKGFSALGMTDHSYMDDPGRDWGMALERIPAYRQEMAQLKEKYKDQITLLCGIEQDIFSPLPPDGYDYTIGSVHAVEKEGKLFEVDDTLEMVKENLRYFADPYEYAEAYFRLMAALPERFSFDIIGHFDLLTKWQEKEPLFDESHPRYRAAVEEALKTLIPLGIPFEVNCGAISRGYRTAPYPAPPILRSIYERGGEIIITGDCHNAAWLGLGFERALALAKECGFERVVTLSANGKEYINI